MKKKKISNSIEHLDWTYDQLQDFLNKTKNLGYISRYMTHMVKNIEQKTSFLDDIYPNPISLAARANVIRSNIQTSEQIPKCVVCGKYSMIRKKTNDFSETCSKKCSDYIRIKNMERTNLLKYGTKHPAQSNKKIVEKRKQTNMERYGVYLPFQSDKIREKARESIRERYGVCHPSQIDGFKESVRGKWDAKTDDEKLGIWDSRKKTNKEKYGNEIILNVPEFNEIHRKSMFETMRIRGEDIVRKRKSTSMERYGVDNPSKSEVIQRKIKSVFFEKYGTHHKRTHMKVPEVIDNPTLFKQKYEELGIVGLADYIGCHVSTIYYITKNLGIREEGTITSQLENEIREIIEGHGLEVEQGNREILGGLELDILIPSKKIAIEFNGLYWHSEQYKEKNYHKMKTDLCEEKGYQLIHIFEDEWIYKKEIVLRTLLNKLGISNEERLYARKTTIKEVDTSESNEFLESNHIQGKVSGTIRLGLYDKKERLVALMVLLKQKNGVWNLVRYATSCNVVGGFTKLLKHFQRNYEWKKIITFADRRWSQGDLYYNSGFEMVGELYPDYTYIIGDRRQHKFGFRHRQLKNKLENYDPNLTEHQNMLNHRFFRIYDAGKLKFELTC